MTEASAFTTVLADWQSAELAAVVHMKSIGFIDATLTKSGADGGIDVESSEAAAQVKFYANPVGRPDIQRLRGAAHTYRLALFYSTGGYTSEAVEYADQAQVALFHMDAFGRVEIVSSSAAMLTESTGVQERRNKLEALKAERYRFAELALRRDLDLYQEFGSRHLADPLHSKLFPQVAWALDLVVQRFNDAISSRDFAAADSAFTDALLRKHFLSGITTAELTPAYTDINEAVENGWLWHVSSRIEDNFSNLVSGIFELHHLLIKSWDPWKSSLVLSTIYAGIPENLLHQNVMLSACAIDHRVLTKELLRDLLRDVRAQLQQSQKSLKSAQRSSAGTTALMQRLFQSQMLYTEKLFTRLFAQLEAIERAI